MLPSGSSRVWFPLSSAYVQDETRSPSWSMIDKITLVPTQRSRRCWPRDGFEDNYTIVTEKHTFTAPFVNAEETQYLCIEDHYTNGRPPLELGGVLYCDRETVDKIEKMKVCTCLNPLHTCNVHLRLHAGLHPHQRRDGRRGSAFFIQKIGISRQCPWSLIPVS